MGQANVLARLSHRVYRLRLKHTWALAAASIDFKDTLFVRIRRDGVEGLGEAAPNSRFGETPESAIAFIEKARPLLEALI